MTMPDHLAMNDQAVDEPVAPAVVVLSGRETLPACAETQSDATTCTERVVAILGALVVTSGVVGAGLWQWDVGREAVPPAVVVPAAVARAFVPPAPSTPNSFRELTLTARSAVVYDIDAKRVLYARDADRVLPLASLTKLMTALLAVEGKGATSTVRIAPAALSAEGDFGLVAGERWALDDLVSFTMLTSSNDGALALALATDADGSGAAGGDKDDPAGFVARMNERAARLGFKDMRFLNPTGLDEGTSSGGMGTADEVARLIAYLWEREPRAVAHTTERSRVFASLEGTVHMAQNTNEHTDAFPGLYAGKTGYTDLAGGNLAVVYDAGLNHPMAVVVLGSTREERFTDVRTIVDAVYAYIESGWYAYEIPR